MRHDTRFFARSNRGLFGGFDHAKPAHYSRVGTYLVAFLSAFLILSACGAGRVPPQAVSKITLESLNSTLNLAVDFYAEQKSACHITPGAIGPASNCRFSVEGLEQFRQKLLLANTAFRIAVEAADAALRGTGSQAEANAKIENAEAAIKALPQRVEP